MFAYKSKDVYKRQGQKELCEAIAGLRPIQSGLMIHKGDNIVGLPPKTILEKGISMSFIPEDRLGMGLAPSMSITDNMILKNSGETKGPFVDRNCLLYTSRCV